MKNQAPKNKESLTSVSGKKKRINSKAKGSTYERAIAKLFREQFNYRFAKCSRQASKLLDDCKIDISGVPYNIQTKSGYAGKYQRPMPDEIFRDMKARLLENFDENDPVHKLPKILFHKIDAYKDENQLVTMMFHEWVEMFKVYEKYKNLNHEKTV